MSTTTFDTTKDHRETKVPLANGGQEQGLFPEMYYSNLSVSLSPDSPSSISIQSDREASSSPDINMLECCLSDTASLQGDHLCDVNQTFTVTPVNGSLNIWNENLSLIGNRTITPEDYKGYDTNAQDARNNVMKSQSLVGEDSEINLCEVSRRGSSETDGLSIGSVDMILRSNSFCLADQSLLEISSLDNSSVSSATGHPLLPDNNLSKSNVISPALPDVCEKFTNNIAEGSSGNVNFGMTFTFEDNWALPPEQRDMISPNSPVVLPSENEGGLLMTFVCEKSSDNENQLHFLEEAQLPHLAEACAQEHGKTCAFAKSAVEDTKKDAHTSTPVQNTGKKIPSLPSFSESPFTENTGISRQGSTRRKQTSVTQPLVARIPASSKDKKLELKKFPKSDFSGIKSKVVTRIAQQTVAPSRPSQSKPLQVNVHSKNNEKQRGATPRTSPVKGRNSATASAAKAKRDVGAQKQGNIGTPALDMAVKTFEHPLSDGPCRAPPTANIHAKPETEHRPSNHISDSSAHCPGNQTFCLSSFEKSPDSSQTCPEPTPKRSMPNKIEVRSGAALSEVRRRLRCSSECLPSSSRPAREKKAMARVSTVLSISKNDMPPPQTKPGPLKSSSQDKAAVQPEAAESPAENSPREVKKISLLTEPGKTPGASLDDSKARVRPQPSPRHTKGAPLSQTPAASPRPTALSARQRQGTNGKVELRVSNPAGITQLRQKITAVGQRAQAAGEASIAPALAASNKPQLTRPHWPQTPTHLAHIGHPPTPASRILRKNAGQFRSQAEQGLRGELGERTSGSHVSGGAEHKPVPTRTVVLKARLIPTPAKNAGPTFSSTCKPAASVGHSGVSPQAKTSSRFVRLASSIPVDKIKPKTSSRQQYPHQRASAAQPNQSSGPPDVVPPGVPEAEKRVQKIQELQELNAAANSRFEALSVVLHQALAERDEASRQCKELSQELVNLRGELVSSSYSSERLEKEKQEVRVALENALQHLQEQHQRDQEDLEQRLQAFYQAEWDKVHLTYQEEADKCKTLMQQQMADLTANHEAMKLELESNHAEQLRRIKHQHEQSVEELRNLHEKELESLDRSLKEAEATLSGQIEELTSENSVLLEKLAAEENKRRELAEKSQKDSHTVYLEQELESLRVVLDIKNKQLHHQEKKMMEIDKLTEKNMQLDECLKKVQQENEELKARMERHAALSRQLSTEQAMLQESLQKESKVNKRLSMENEELLWKLHNGDLSTPHKVSPTSTSPSHSFSLQSPRGSDIFPISPISPR